MCKDPAIRTGRGGGTRGSIRPTARACWYRAQDPPPPRLPALADATSGAQDGKQGFINYALAAAAHAHRTRRAS